MAPGAWSKFGASTFGFEVFGKKMYCIEKGNREIVGTFQRPGNCAPLSHPRYAPVCTWNSLWGGILLSIEQLLRLGALCIRKITFLFGGHTLTSFTKCRLHLVNTSHGNFFFLQPMLRRVISLFMNKLWHNDGAVKASQEASLMQLDPGCTCRHIQSCT